ncbi:MAG: protoheme IX farnesyltransferase [Acidobacteria bacterium]|nr:protoheme IX farnesyltransferase [Acidobacteriota bacterium]HMU33676.1 heme o synthase [Pyrinomonadaceae bacterium]
MASAATDIQTIRTASVREKIAAYFELTKPRIAFLLVLTSAAGFYMGSQKGFDAVTFGIAMAAICLLAFGVATLNQYAERSIDPKMERTARRPLPTGRVTRNEALIFGVLQCAIAEIGLFVLVNPLTAYLGLAVIVGYNFVYTPLKTRTSASTAIGAIPGALPPLMGWTAATGDITLVAWSLFLIQFLWQFPHFFAIAWLYREQYKRAGIVMLPVVEPTGRITMRQIVLFTILLVPMSFAPFFFAHSGFIFLIGAILLGFWILFASVKCAIEKTDKAARKLLLVTVVYLPLLFLLMVIDKK